jgi:putative DNA primase/helicase
MGSSINRNDKQTIERLAVLSPLEYDRCRKDEAKKLGISVATLNKEVSNVRNMILPEAKQQLASDDVEEWSEPIDMAMLLDEIVTTIHSFIICDRQTAIATALWVAFTWVIDHVQVAPIAVITAPEMRCGKSQLLNLIGKISKNPLVASNISSSAVFRVIEASKPTLLIDEADTFLKQNEELRGIINSGHTRQSAYVIRNIGVDHEPKQFSTWGAKVICGIGSLAGTIEDRAIKLELRRKLPSESVERLRHADSSLFNVIKSKLARFEVDAGFIIARARPKLPEALNDRAQDNWEPLLAIADYAGGGWSDNAKAVALKICSVQHESVSLSTELLADIKGGFETKLKNPISTTDLIAFLVEDDLKPWATYNRGKPISPRQLAKRLEEYGIKSKNIRFSFEVKKGFDKEQFEDVFNRYLNNILSNTPEISATTLQSDSSGYNIIENPVADSVACSGYEQCVADDNVACSGYEKATATPTTPETLGYSGVAVKLGETSNNIIEVEL